MSKDTIITGLDIGANKIRTVIALYDEEKEKPHIIGVSVVESQGMRKGTVVDINELIENISKSLEEAEKMSGVPIYNAFVSIGGIHLRGINSKGVVAIGGHEINDYDIERVLEAAQAISIPVNEKIIRVIPKDYTVDGIDSIKNPLGMSGARLEANAHIVTAQNQAVNSLEKCCHQGGVDVAAFVPVTLAVSEAVLTKKQKELGVVSVDIGACSTSIVVYEEGVVLHSAVLPVGGESVTNDLAIGLRTSIETAEKIKIEYGSALPSDISERETIDLSLISKIDTHKVSKKEISTIIQARYMEIFHLVRKELKSINRDGMLPAGVVLTGAAIKMPGVIDLARDSLSLPTQIGFPQNITSIIDKIDDTSYSTAIGLIHWGSKYGGEESGGINVGDFFNNIGQMFKKLLP